MVSRIQKNRGTEEKSWFSASKLKTISIGTTAIVSLLGSLWALDSHYASAADVQQMKQDFNSQIAQMRQEKIEDALFELDMKKQAQKGKLSPVDQAMYERYQRRLQDIKDQQKQQPSQQQDTKK